jgi:hypothetical protein
MANVLNVQSLFGVEGRVVVITGALELAAVIIK